MPSNVVAIARNAACLLAVSLAAVFLIPGPLLGRADDLSSSYQWKPVRIGGGGWVVGMVLHPLDSTVRCARTDVGNAYRWDQSAQQWIPVRVSNPDGSGIRSASATSAPSGYGVSTIAVDPTNTSVVYIVFPTVQSCDVHCPTNFVEIYKSTDGGRNFTPGNMTSAAIKGDPNGAHRWAGERLAIDPANPSVLYYASDSQGVFRSFDSGSTWSQLTGPSAPPTNIEFINIQFAKSAGTATLNNITVSKTIYAVSINNNDTGGDVYQSSDGGQTWTDISTGITDTASNQSLTHQALSSSIDPADNLYIAENSVTNGYHRAYWRYSSGKWTRFSLEGSINQPVVSVAVDPTNAQRIYALAADTGLARSDNGGQSWINLGGTQFANSLGWLPQTIGMSNGAWHSNGGLKIDSAGNLWTPTGQEGPLTLAASAAAGATSAAPPKWTIVTSGIEELVAMDIAIPPGSGDTAIALAMDTTGFTFSNPDNFSAVQIPLQQEIISQGTSVDYAPDAPTFIAVTSSNPYTNGPNYSGYSTDSGKTWQRFSSMPKYTCSGKSCDIPAGLIAVSPRGTRTLGSDHIVLYPPQSFAPQYSQDGGKTWHVTQSFPLNADGLTINTANFSSFLYPQLTQHMLRADPFTSDKFYLKFTHAPAMLYISTDGGKTWTGQQNTGLPDYTWTGQLIVNHFARNDLWFADGWEAASAHGVFHSTDGGQTFQQLPGISHALVIAIGAHSGQPADAAYTLYFYGQLSSDANWGVFRSTNAGSTWDRIAYYPNGTWDRPTTMAASQDTFGKLYIGTTGESWVYGQLTATPPPPLPAAPTALTATGVSNSEIDLAWTAPTGAVSSYNIYRGATSGAEAATPIATGITQTTYADKSLTQAQTYFYKVTAVNSTGEGPASNEASATATQPAVSLALASGASSSASVTAGQSATFKLVLNSTNYAGAINFSCAGAPSGYTCVVPSALNLIPTTTTTAVSITAQSNTTAADDTPAASPVSFAAVLAFLPVLFLFRNRARMFLVILLAVTLLPFTSCGGGSTPPTKNRQPSTYALTVTATGTGVPSTTQTLSLTIQ
jgi:hypothetical protein